MVEVKRERDKVWLEGVKGFSPGDYASSVHGSQARLLQALGEQLTYSDLVCYSGFAFRTEVHEEMCPSAGHPCCGYECFDNGFKAIPREVEFFDSFPWNEEKEDREAFEAEARAAVKSSIDRGVPVHYCSEEDGLIIGYTDGGNRWLCTHPYHKWGAETFWHDEVEGFAGGKWPWGIVVWKDQVPKDSRTNPEELLRNALEQAVDMWNTERKEAYFCGEAAYDHWLDWLNKALDNSLINMESGMQGNGWCYDVLLQNRSIASKWLKEKAEEVGGKAGEHLLAASGNYGKMAEILSSGLDCTWNLAMPPERASEWTDEKKRYEINRLEEAREHDRAAIIEIGKALETM